MEKLIAAIDQGTTSTRCLIFNHEGRVISSDQAEHRQIYPQPGWVEHDPLEIMDRVRQVLVNSLEKASLTSKHLVGIGITNQRETTVVWNRITGKPYANAIVWQDVRTDNICKELAQTIGEDTFRDKTGLPLATYFSGPKLKWILEQDPDVRRDALKGEALFGNIDTWIVWNLTGGPGCGVFITDVSNASRTLLMNLETLDWDDEILDVMNIPRSMLPTIQPSSSIIGLTHDVYKDVPISGILGDQQAALFGQTCFLPGEVKNTYGTGCFMLLNTGIKPIRSKNGLLTTLGYKIGDQPAHYCLEGSIAITGALVQWLRDNLKIIDQSADIEKLAKSVADSGGIYFVPAFSGLFAPYWRSDARGILIGLTRYIHGGHIARAALEATAYQTREVLEAMEMDSGVKIKGLKVDGGMVHNELLMQFQSDILDIPVVRPIVAETTALGAAYAAGLAVGYWKNQDELRQHWTIDKEWQPAMDANTRDHLYRGWKKAVTHSFNWLD